MRILDKRNIKNREELKDIPTASVFEASEGFYFKTSSYSRDGHFKCVNLETGIIYEFYKTTPIRPLDAEISIEWIEWIFRNIDNRRSR